MTAETTEPTRREVRRRETERRIRDRALELTDARGLDGWTMEDLAEASDVSRRTLFNYVSGKVDAVLGAGEELHTGAVEVFAAGGPTGRLIDDCVALAEAILAEETFDAEQVATRRRVLTTSPRLLVAVHERFELIMAELVDHILRREGPSFGRDRARLLVRLFVSVFDAALHQFLEDPDGRPVAELFEENVVLARDLLA